MFSSLISGTSGNAGQYSSRNGAKIDRIILHHAASTSIFAVLDMMKYGTREVSSNYVIGNEGEIIGVVPEEFRAWTSGSASWDGRAITFEIVNETGAPDWRISDKAFHAVARMLADISARYGIVLSRDTVITHQELFTRYGASYATACPGPFLQPRVDDLIQLAITLTVTKVLEGSMSNPIISVPDGRGTLYIGTDNGEFVQYATPKAMNSRGIISKVFYGGPGGDKDTIPSLGWQDFEVAKTVWKQMCGK